MDNTTQNGAPLTRRQAREIERRTGVRPVASAEPGSSFRREDTGRIERNEMTALISVLPTEMLQQISEPAAAAQETTRGLTVRAARPAALIAQRRRRTAGGFAAAASVTALAAVGLTTVAGQGAVVADSQHQADLLSAVNSQVSGATANAVEQAAQEAEAEAAAAEEQAAPAAEAAEATEIESFDTATVASAAVAVPAPEPEPEETASAASSDSGSSESSESSDSTSSSGGSAPAAAPATGNIQQDMLNYAQSMLGSYGMDCTDYVQNALAAAGLTTPRTAGGPDLGVSSFAQFGTAIDPSQAQAGDIMIKHGYHVAIYAGGGQAYHGGWNGAADDNVLTSYQADPYFYDLVIRVG